MNNYKVCQRCSKPFRVYPYNADKRRFCSTSCSNKSTNLQQSKTKRARAKQNTSNDVKWRYNVLYIEWRNACLARDNFRCQNCNRLLSLRQAVVHHIKSWRDCPELRYTISNGMTVCRPCHNIVDENLCRGRYGYK